MRYIVIITLLLAIAFQCYSSESIYIPDIADTLYIGQVLSAEIDLSKTQPERLYIDRRQRQKELEFFDLQVVPEKPWHYLLRIAAFDTGFVQTERFPIYAMTAGVADTFYVEPFGFYVKSSLTFSDVLSDSLLADIAPPVSFSLKFWDYAFPIAVLLLFVGGILLARRYLKKLQHQQYVIPTDTRPAWQKAMELLTAFKQKHYLEDGQYLDYYFDLSIIFRYFIEWQYNIKAVEMTTYEIKQSLNEMDKKRDIITILSEMDMVKFAKSVPDESRAKDMLIWIENYILSFSVGTPFMASDATSDAVGTPLMASDATSDAVGTPFMASDTKSNKSEDSDV